MKLGALKSTAEKNKSSSSCNTSDGNNKENQQGYYFTKSSGATTKDILGNYSKRISKPAIQGHDARDRRSNRRKRIQKSKDEILAVKKLGTESSDSENSSPNSVLDNKMDFPCDPEDDNTISGN